MADSKVKQALNSVGNSAKNAAVGALDALGNLWGTISSDKKNRFPKAKAHWKQAKESAKPTVSTWLKLNTLPGSALKAGLTKELPRTILSRLGDSSNAAPINPELAKKFLTRKPEEMNDGFRKIGNIHNDMIRAYFTLRTEADLNFDSTLEVMLENPDLIRVLDNMDEDWFDTDEFLPEKTNNWLENNNSEFSANFDDVVLYRDEEDDTEVTLGELKGSHPEQYDDIKKALQEHSTSVQKELEHQSTRFSGAIGFANNEFGNTLTANDVKQLFTDESAHAYEKFSKKSNADWTKNHEKTIQNALKDIMSDEQAETATGQLKNKFDENQKTAKTEFSDKATNESNNLKDRLSTQENEQRLRRAYIISAMHPSIKNKNLALIEGGPELAKTGTDPSVVMNKLLDNWDKITPIRQTHSGKELTVEGDNQKLATLKWSVADSKKGNLIHRDIKDIVANGKDLGWETIKFTSNDPNILAQSYAEARAQGYKPDEIELVSKTYKHQEGRYHRINYDDFKLEPAESVKSKGEQLYKQHQEKLSEITTANKTKSTERSEQDEFKAAFKLYRKKNPKEEEVEHADQGAAPSNPGL